jgi:hypothetical protein
MAKKRAGAVPLVSGLSWILELDDFDWKTLESAYGQSLSRQQRQRIFDATQTYVAFRGREVNSQPLRVSIGRVERLKKSAESFRKALVEGDNGSMANVFAHHEIKLQFSDDYSVAPDYIAELTRVLGSFVRACETVLENYSKNRRQLDSIEANGIPGPDGIAWRNWIVELTSVTDEFGLPSGARTDTDKNKRGPSPFVRLANELQAQLPEKLQRKPQSAAALAKAINRARANYDRDRRRAKSALKKSRND